MAVTGGKSDGAAAVDLPISRAELFDLIPPYDCDMVIKGSITPDLVYPYATYPTGWKIAGSRKGNMYGRAGFS